MSDNLLQDEYQAGWAEGFAAGKLAAPAALADEQKFDIEVALRDLLSACNKVFDVVNTYGSGSERLTFYDSIDDARAVLAAQEQKR